MSDHPRADLEAIRRAHVQVEANVKSVGLLAIILGMVAALLGLFAVLKTPVVGVAVLVVAALAFVSGLGLRAFDVRGRSAFFALAGILAVGVTAMRLADGEPWGDVLTSSLLAALAAPAMLHQLTGPKACVVFSAHYRDVVVPATAHVKPKTPLVAAAVLVVIMVALVAAIVGIVAMSR